MLSVEKSFVCSSCDICGKEKSADLMCTFIVSPQAPTEPEKVCWCVCSDCVPVLEHIDEFYRDAT